MLCQLSYTLFNIKILRNYSGFLDFHRVFQLLVRLLNVTVMDGMAGGLLAPSSPSGELIPAIKLKN